MACVPLLHEPLSDPDLDTDFLRGNLHSARRIQDVPSPDGAAADILQMRRLPGDTGLFAVITSSMQLPAYIVDTEDEYDFVFQTNSRTGLRTRAQDKTFKAKRAEDQSSVATTTAKLVLDQIAEGRQRLEAFEAQTAKTVETLSGMVVNSASTLSSWTAQPPRSKLSRLHYATSITSCTSGLAISHFSASHKLVA